MKIKYALLCDSAFIGQGNKLYINGIFENLNFEQVPARYLEKVTAVLFLEGKKDEQFEYYIALKGPKGDEVFNSEKQKARAATGSNGRANIYASLSGFEAKEIGEYKFIVHVGDVSVELPLMVKLQGKA